MKKKGRPGGNPGLKKYQFTTTRKYPLTQLAAFRIDEPTKAAIKAGKLPNWQEIAREAVEKALAEVEAKENITSA